MTLIGRTRLTKAEFYSRGGFANPHQFRTMLGKAWTYWSTR